VFSVNDGVDALLLGMFFFGLLFTLGTLLLGVADVGFGHGSGHVDHGGHEVSSALNFGVILAFITWFGGIAYLARNGLSIPLLLSLLIGIAGGVLGGMAIYRLLRLVRSKETVLRAEDYRLPGVIARVTSSIRENGTGEVVYVQQGVRQVAAARSTDGTAIPRGAEVVILRSEKGIVYVDLWENLMERTEREPARLP
jgi:membrane protein implicated in regulation of membrane protease activity